MEDERSLLTLDSQCMRVWELNESSSELKVHYNGQTLQFPFLSMGSMV